MNLIPWELQLEKILHRNYIASTNAQWLWGCSWVSVKLWTPSMTRLVTNWAETKNSSKKLHGLGELNRNWYIEFWEQNAGSKSKYIGVFSIGKTSLFSVLSQTRWGNCDMFIMFILVEKGNKYIFIFLAPFWLLHSMYNIQYKERKSL